MPSLHAPYIQTRLAGFQALFTEATVSRPLQKAKDSIAAHQRIIKLPFIRFSYKAAVGKAADLARNFNSKLLEAKAASARGLLTLRQQLLKATDVPNAEALASKVAVIVGTMPATAAAEHELLPPSSATTPATTPGTIPASTAALTAAATAITSTNAAQLVPVAMDTAPTAPPHPASEYMSVSAAPPYPDGKLAY